MSRRNLLVLIMLLAAFLRAEYLLQIEHNVDHAYPIWQALQTLDRGSFPLTGEGTSVLFANPPLTGYLFLPVVALTRSPLGVYVLVIALNTLGVLLAYRSARLIVGETLALIAAFLMAVNPWVIEYSRTSWVQSLLPFLVPALTYALWSVLLGKAAHPGRRLLIAFVILTVLAQTYLLDFMLVIPVGLLIVVFWRRIPKRALVAGVTLFALAAAIYGAGLLAQRAAVEQRLSSFSSSAPHLSSEALGHALRLVTGSDYAIARGTLAPIRDSALRENLSNGAQVALLVILVVGIGRAVGQVIGGAQRERAVIVLVWFALPIILMSYVTQVVHPFYQLPGIPAGYVLAAWGFGVLLRPITRLSSPQAAGAVAAALLIPFGVLMGINSARYYQDTAATPGIDGLSALPLDYGLKLGEAIRDRLPATVYSDVDEWDLSSFSGETLDFVRDARAPAFNFIPPNGGLYVAAYPSEPVTDPLGVDQAVKLHLPDGTLLVVDHLSQSADRPITQNLNIPGDQGITLASYRLGHAGDQWTLTTYWRIDARVDQIDTRLFAPFAHIFDADGKRVLIVDGQSVPGYEWRVGDLHAHRMNFALPTDGVAPYSISVGQYDALHNQNVIFVLPSGEYTPLIPLPDQLRP